MLRVEDFDQNLERRLLSQRLQRLVSFIGYPPLLWQPGGCASPEFFNREISAALLVALENALNIENLEETALTALRTFGYDPRKWCEAYWSALCSQPG